MVELAIINVWWIFFSFQKLTSCSKCGPMQESLIPYIECLGLEFYFKSYMFGCETSRK